MSWGANIDDKVDGLFASIDRSGARARAAARDLSRVPRAPRPVQPGKIDISSAPSAMEERARKWSAR
jgi:hypothetical protein